MSASINELIRRATGDSPPIVTPVKNDPFRKARHWEVALDLEVYDGDARAKQILETNIH